MKMYGLVLAAALTACSTPAPRPEASPLDWLAGCWRLERENGAYEEAWLPAAPDGTLGVSRERRGDRTVGYEFLRIERRPDEVVYVAQPSGQARAEFALTQRDERRMVFENPRHDFPTRIEYERLDEDALTARVSGPRKDGTRVIEYPMRRIACEGG